MNDNVCKAIIAEVDFGFTKVEGLMLPDGTYALAVSQANKFLNFCATQRNALRTLKGLLGEDLMLLKLPTEVSTTESLILTTPQFTQLVRVLDKKGNNPTATDFIDAIVEEGVDRRFASAFKKIVTEEEWSALLEQRMKRLATRRKWTDVLKERFTQVFGSNPTPTHYKQWTVRVNKGLFKRVHFNCNRNNMTPNQQQTIELFESMCVQTSQKYPSSNPDFILDLVLSYF